MVEQLITATMKKEKAVLGLEEALLALQEGRAWQLVYADSFNVRGGECKNCGALLMEEGEPCAYCGKDVFAVNDLIQLAAERMIDAEGKVEQVCGPAAQRLNEVGSIGALLRF